MRTAQPISGRISIAWGISNLVQQDWRKRLRALPEQDKHTFSCRQMASDFAMLMYFHLVEALYQWNSSIPEVPPPSAGGYQEKRERASCLLQFSCPGSVKQSVPKRYQCLIRGDPDHRGAGATEKEGMAQTRKLRRYSRKLNLLGLHFSVRCSISIVSIALGLKETIV